MHKKWFRVLSWMALVAFATVSVYLVQHNATVLRTSLIPSASHKAFDGTVFPVQKTPNWAQLTSAEYDNVYSAIPAGKLIDMPYYNPSDFQTSFNSLTWGDPATEDIRNAKITYSVPYMGDYTLDSTEYSGSHLALDIKAPKGTPVFAMANGVVTKLSIQSSGFGNHIVLEHKNFPTIDNENQFTTYYSSYSHLDSVLVSEGEVVDKGDQLGLLGDTGTATTPHLHFQIDNENADWHPFWPFTWQEANAAGLSFFEAINSGLGQSKARSTTINPMGYVQKYLDPSASVVASAVSYVEPEEVEPKVVEPKVVEPEVVPEVIIAVDPVEETVEPATVSFEVVSRASYDEGVTAYLTVYVKDENGDVYTGDFDGIVNLSLNNEIGVVEKDRLSADDFVDGKVQLSVRNLDVGKAKLKLAYGQSMFYSDWFEVDQPEVVEEVSTSTSFSDVPESHPNYDAITYLASEGVIGGYPDGTFRPDNSVTRAEALKFIMVGAGNGLEVSDLPFGDISSNDWFYNYVSTAYLRSVVSGYPDGTFKAGNLVNRAEFFKMLLVAMDIPIPTNVSKDPFTDVGINDWPAPYFQYVKDHELIDATLRAWPTAGMKRGDVAEAMYRLSLN
jgi:murein DD-endopeptidase MepM/ murein hydrolase activator NlpD